MFLHSLTSAVTQFYALAPSVRQLEEIAKVAKKAVPYVSLFDDDNLRHVKLNVCVADFVAQ